MEALRLTLNSSRLASVIDLPLALRDCEVEVIILPSHSTSNVEQADNRETNVESIMGILKEYANPELRELEKSAWEQATVEKYLENMNDGGA